MKRGKAKKSDPSKKRFIYTAVVMVVFLVPTVLFLQSYFTGQGTPKAAIIDQLGSKLDELIRYENQTFLNTAEELVYKRFSVVDFYSDNATVEQYEQLASAGYKLIVWRAHSALDLNSNYVAISTTDKEGSINTDEYLRNGQQTLTLCNITGDPILYYAITPEFIQEVMPGAFHDTVIVLMSCNGLKQGYLRTAQAFQAKGATVVISWDGWVDASNNDLGGTLLLQRLIDGKDSVTVAINNTSFFSPEFGWASLQYYPQSLKVGNYQIPDYRQDTLHDGLMTSTSFRKTEKPQRESST